MPGRGLFKNVQWSSLFRCPSTWTFLQS